MHYSLGLYQCDGTRQRRKDLDKTKVLKKISIKWFDYNCYGLSRWVHIKHARNYVEHWMGGFVVDGNDSTNNTVQELK